ncbi:MAG TPA: NAD(P)H-dependent oxidoreductase [Bacteroidia bacterium]|nr:NAD(P)H-dependent oxidoreductase [Bacteroidia bacterium]
MVTIISGTNRPGSTTAKVAAIYAKTLTGIGIESQVFSLEELPADFAFSYLQDRQNGDFRKLLEKYILPADRIVAVIPEYNGTFPGIFKLLLDAIHPRNLAHKKMALVGVANGRGGNIRGIDQITNALHYMGVTVYHQVLPLSRLSEGTSASGAIDDANVLNAIKKQAEGFVKF